MRRTLIVGNWKMNLDLQSARQLLNELCEGMESIAADDSLDVAVCPPHTLLFPIAKATADTPIHFGAQNLFHEPSGAFTGEISASMIAETGARYVILGHSERRHTIGHLEDDRMINLKVRAALAGGLTPIVCVGETLAERNTGETPDVLTFQIAADLVGVSQADVAKLVIAYEPVWAIGTGKVATADQAQQAHEHIRTRLRDQFDSAADTIPILYGGSMKPDNAGELIAQRDIDGGLIGGASLKAEPLLGIIRAALAARG